MHLISVVITTKNSARTINRCLSSLMPYLRQGYISDIIVVDGHSTDGTVEIVRKYPVKLIFEEGMERYERSIIKSHYSKFHALNLGWRSSSTDLIMFLDSDAYLRRNFFPKALEFFVDPSLGVLGCWHKAWITTKVTKTIGELWHFNGKLIKSFQSDQIHLASRLYKFVISFGKKIILTSGPCYIVRRSCLELLGGHDIQGDVGISLRLQEKGFKSLWWVEAPIYHLPRETLLALAKQRYMWGMDGAFRPKSEPSFYFVLFLRPILSVILGLYLTIKFHNCLHLAVLPVAEFSLLVGYIIGLYRKFQGKE